MLARALYPLVLALELLASMSVRFIREITAVSSPVQAGRSVVAGTRSGCDFAIHAAGCQIQYVDVAGDLGIDRGRRATGRLPKHANRQGAADRRAARIIRIPRVARGTPALGCRLYFCGTLGTGFLRQ